MSIHGYVGNIITANPTAPTSTVASGVWTTEQQLQAIAAGNWPFTIPTQQISRSLRFNRPDSAYLNRTFSTGNRKTWTWSCWIKRSTLDVGGGDVPLISSVGASSTYDSIRFNSDSTFRIYYSGGAAYAVAISGSPVFRDVSAWYHIVVAQDTTQATEANRLRVWINGVQQTLTGIPAQNYESGFNNGVQHEIGKQYIQSEYFPGYMAEAYFIGGSALTPSSFGRTSTTTGVWEPIAYTGSYAGTNSFYLPFSDNASTTTLGDDFSGNNNDWTPNNFSVTAGVGNDSLVDSPTPYGTDTGVGGEVRGNYCTLNPLDNGTSGNTLSNGNLQIVTGTSGYGGCRGTMFVSSGKWYWETTVTSIGIGAVTGIWGPNTAIGTNNCGATSDSYSYWSDGQKQNNNSQTAYGASYTTNDVIGTALDLDAGTLVFYKNNSSQGTAYSGLSGSFSVGTGDLSIAGTCTMNFNFGQRAFAYTAPSGFKALCTTNLPTPTIGATSTTQANDYFNVVLWTGNSSASQAITGVGFQPDLVWAKARPANSGQNWVDAVRGATKNIRSNSTDAEATVNTVISFQSDGFTVGDGNGYDINKSGESVVGWCWNAGGSNATNTAGNITSTVRANTTSGFSIVTYTGNGSANQTVGHGLGVAPVFGILKDRDTNSNNSQWQVFHTAAGDKYAYLSTTAAFAGTAEFYPTSGSSTTVTVGRGSPAATTNESGDNFVMYLFTPVAGYSAFGSYTGNASTDGPFIYTGFRPAYVLIKSSSNAGTEWEIRDDMRLTYNPETELLFANSSSATYATDPYYKSDFLSNGFKLRNTNSASNGSGFTYVYAAFAEFPFKYSLAR